MDYKYSCVVDADHLYKTFVLVYLEPGEGGEIRETISGYELTEGERLLEVSPPSNLVKPRWNGEAWEEAATAEEIESWKQENPTEEMGSPSPSPLEALQAENNLLRAQITAASSRQDFLEDCIAEMAVQVYNA